MRGQLAWVVAPALLVSVFLGPKAPAAAEEYAALIASPIGGHSGDTVYLSGLGLVPNHRFPYVMMACPNWNDPSTLAYNNGVERTPGPSTDARGQFKAFPFTVLVLRHWKSLGCQIYIPDGDNPYGPRFPAAYTIEPSDSKLDRCWRRICLDVKAVPKRVRSGFVEKVEIHSHPGPWPGALVDVSVSYPGGQPSRHRLTLDFTGYARTQFPVAVRATRPVVAQIRARARLGTWGGDGTGHFTIVH